MTVKVYFNPRCSKCRKAVELLEERGIEYELVHYLENPLTQQELDGLRELLGGDSEMVRRDEAEFAELGLENASWDELRGAIIQHPGLLQRPIAVLDDRAVIARPPERILEVN